MAIILRIKGIQPFLRSLLYHQLPCGPESNLVLCLVWKYVYCTMLVYTRYKKVTLSPHTIGKGQSPVYLSQWTPATTANKLPFPEVSVCLPIYHSILVHYRLLLPSIYIRWQKGPFPQVFYILCLSISCHFSCQLKL